MNPGTRLAVVAGAAFLAASGRAAASPHRCVDLLARDGAGAASLRAAATRTVEARGARRAVAFVLRGVPDGPASRRARWLCSRLRLGAPRYPVRLTGYYRPVLSARRSPGAGYRVPLYGLPPASVCAGATCPSRAAIDRGALAGKAPVLAWLADPVDAYFLHVQGSGLLRLEDGTLRGVGWAGSNGRPYRSIGKLAIERGWLEPGKAGMESLLRLLRANPRARRELFDANPRYVFFRETDGRVIGSAGIELVAGRSAAADPDLYPPGTVLVLQRPDGASRIVLVHDTGAAIRGPRLDLFTGTGRAAGREAGGIHETVTAVPLLPRRQKES